MTTSRKWSPLVAFALLTVLLAVSVGPSGGAAEPRVTNKTITIPAGAFSITDDSYDFHNDGRGLYMEAGYGAFSAPLFFESRQVTVNSITLYAYDNNSTQNVCVSLYRTTPWDGGEAEMGQVCTSGASANNRSFTEANLAIRQITGSYGPYLWIYFPTSSNLKVFGVRISYGV